METVYCMKRCNLRWLMQQHPTWTCRQLAEAVEMSLGWVKTWRRRWKESEPGDEQVLHSRTRAPKHPRPRISEEVAERVVALRDEPPEGLRRVPSPHGSAFPSALRRLCGKIAPLLSTRMPRSGAASHPAGSRRSHQPVCRALQQGASQSSVDLPQSPPSGGSSPAPDVTFGS